MATGFVLDSVDFANEPDSTQSFTFEYKLFSDPESSYVVIDSGVSVDTDGTILASPLPTVTGLSEGTVYFVRATNECTSPVEYYVQQIQT